MRRGDLKILMFFLAMVIGVGLFALPFLAVQAGLLFFFLFLAAAAVVVFGIHGLFAEVACETAERHRVPGYVRLYLGKPAGILASVTSTAVLFGAQIAYLIVGGGFLFFLARAVLPLQPIWFVALFFVIGNLLIFSGRSLLAGAELWLMLLFFALIGLVAVAAYPAISFETFSELFRYSERPSLLPYGALIFSLWGAVIVPELAEMTRGSLRRVRQVLFFGTIISAVTYGFFVLVVVGVSGFATSPDAISGLLPFLGDRVVILGALLGLLATFTSYIAIGLELQRMFGYDFHFPRHAALIVPAVVPLVLFLLGAQNFISVINITGAVFLGLEGLFIIAVHRALRQKTTVRHVILAGILGIGVLAAVNIVPL